MPRLSIRRQRSDSESLAFGEAETARICKAWYQRGGAAREPLRILVECCFARPCGEPGKPPENFQGRSSH